MDWINWQTKLIIHSIEFITNCILNLPYSILCYSAMMKVSVCSRMYPNVQSAVTRTNVSFLLHSTPLGKGSHMRNLNS